MICQLPKHGREPLVLEEVDERVGTGSWDRAGRQKMEDAAVSAIVRRDGTARAAVFRGLSAERPRRRDGDGAECAAEYLPTGDDIGNAAADAGVEERMQEGPA